MMASGKAVLEANTKLIAEYLSGGELSAFGSVDPFAEVDGGLEALAGKLAETSITVKSCPCEDTPYSAFAMGQLMAASAGLEDAEKLRLSMYMQLARREHAPFFKDGITSMSKLHVFGMLGQVAHP